VFGVSIEGHGLIPDNLFGNTKYLDPVQKANEATDELKKNENCDMIICKSHLGINIRIIK
jgi:5'-nucleotidase